MKPQKAGPQMRPICSLVRWNAAERSASMSPRIANTIEVVSRDRQLATKRRRTFMVLLLQGLRTVSSRVSAPPSQRSAIPSKQERHSSRPATRLMSGRTSSWPVASSRSTRSQIGQLWLKLPCSVTLFCTSGSIEKSERLRPPADLA